MFNREIIITASFDACHCWPDAPANVAFLRHHHRHVFHVKLGMPVGHADRDLEFFTEKAKLTRWLRQRYPEPDTGFIMPYSCEMVAEDVLRTFLSASWCEVWEDNENGARVTRQG